MTDLKKREEESFCNHLGHELKIHVSHYRQQEPIIEKTKMSRLLLAIDEGSGYNQGKNLEDICLDGMKISTFVLLLCDIYVQVVFS